MLQNKIMDSRVTGQRETPQPDGDFSRYLPPDDPIRRELESLFPPYPEFKAEESALWES
jgi:hypothetical protein